MDLTSNWTLINSEKALTNVEAFLFDNHITSLNLQP